MTTAVMPKGVEHFLEEVSVAAGSAVTTAVMPKGVEHFWLPEETARERQVTTAVMPKGVEHHRPGSALPAPWRCDDSSDAERR